MISIHNLHKEIKEREGKKNKIFENVYLKVINKIKYTNKFSSDCYCLFQCPNFVYGCPLYDLNSCIIYIMNKLVSNYFQVQYGSPNLLFISWQNIPNPSKANNSYEMNESNYLNTNNLLTLHDFKNKEVTNKNESHKKQDIFSEIDSQFIKENSNINKYVNNNNVFPNINNQFTPNDQNNHNNLNNQNNNNQYQQQFNDNLLNNEKVLNFKNRNKDMILNKLDRNAGPLNLNDVINSNYNPHNTHSYENNQHYNNNSNYNNSNYSNSNNNLNKTTINNLSNDIDNILNELDTTSNNGGSNNPDDDSFIGTLL